MSLEKHVSMLGYRAKDRVTGYSGVITSVSFDLYGCIQAVINPGIAADGKMGEQAWFDVSRLEVIDQQKVMSAPDFSGGPVGEGKHGPAEKPAFN